MTVTIAPVTAADIEGFHAALDDVARESGFLARPTAPPLDSTRAFVTGIIEKGHVQLMAKDGGVIVGWCDVLPREGDDSIGTVGMGVRKSHRGQGLGERLLRAALTAATPKNFAVIRLDVQQRNTGAAALYKKLGFETLRAYRREGENERDLYEMIWRGFPA